MSNGFAGRGTINTARMSRHGRALQNRKGTRVTMGTNVPRQGEGSVGDITVRTIGATGLKCYIKTNSGWYDINKMVDRQPHNWIPINFHPGHNWQQDNDDVIDTGEPAYYKDDNGYVHLRGTIEQTTGTITNRITTFPSGFRPYGDVYRWIVIRQVPTDVDNDLGCIKIATDGAMAITDANLGSAALMVLEGISFYAGMAAGSAASGDGGGGGGGGTKHGMP